MWFSPKIAGALDVLLAPEERRAFGGAGRFTVNFRDRNGVLDRPVSDPLDQPYDLSLWPAAQSRNQLDGTDPRRSRGAFETGAARSLAPDPRGMCRARPRGAEPAVGTAVYPSACRRPGVGRSVCGGDGLACARQPCGAHWRRPPSRGDGNPGGPSWAGFARDLFRRAGRHWRARSSHAWRCEDRARHPQVVSYLLRRPEAGRGDGPPLWHLRPIRRSGVRRRRPCRRPRRLVPPARRARCGGGAAAGHGAGRSGCSMDAARR